MQKVKFHSNEDHVWYHGKIIVGGAPQCRYSYREAAFLLYLP